MRFASASETLDHTLTLPLSNGKEYTIPPISAKAGLELKEIMTLAETVARRVKNDGEDQETVIADVFTSKGYDTAEFDTIGERALSKAVRDQMIEDDVPYPELQLAETTAFLWHTISDGGQQAESYWASGGKAPKPNRAQRRTGTQTQPAEGTTTKKPASRSGTKPRAAASKGKGKAGAGKS